MEQKKTYPFTRLSLWIIFGSALLASTLLVWKTAGEQPVNFLDGDPEFYYYYLQASISPDYVPDYEWLKAGSINSITHQPAGISLIFLPMYLLATLIAGLFGFTPDGMSLPYQIGISLMGILALTSGLHWLSQWFKLRGTNDKVIAGVLLLLFFGSTLFQYSILEPAMSHVYSFAAISGLLLNMQHAVNQKHNRFIYRTALVLGIILLIRPNNIFILFFFPFFFPGFRSFFQALYALIRKPVFYRSLVLLTAFAALQLLIWNRFENRLIANRYAAYGFSWLHPHFKEMLFGFEAGVFIYCPLLLAFLLGLFPLFKKEKFAAGISLIFLLFLFYFFSSYSAYTYFDGLGIRVLVDYYSIFALLGSHLLQFLLQHKMAVWVSAFPFLFLVVVNLIYSYQSSSGILLRAGMNFTKWKYVFLRTSAAYKGVLGGSSDYPPYCPEKPKSFSSLHWGDAGFDYSGKEWGVQLVQDSMGLHSNRVFLELDVERSESQVNSSKDALVCIALEDGDDHRLKTYVQFQLNETPSADCCRPRNYHYGCNLQTQIEPNDKLTVYIWNRKLGAFAIHQFNARLYNYNYIITTP